MEKQFKQLISTMKYIMYMRPVFNTRALFSDETENYISPMEPKPGETVTIRFRTAKENADMVFFISELTKKKMDFEKSEGKFDYFTTQIKMGEEALYYYFEIQDGKVRCFYNKCGVSRNLEQSRAFCIMPGFSTPDWAKGAVFYQIFVDRFYNGDPTNDVEDQEYQYIGGFSSRVTDWNKYPAYMGIREFYGGDLQGVLEKLDYLQELGIDVIYFNPLFVSPSNHKYDIQDYDNIDPHIGKIVQDGGHVLYDGKMDNRFATKYQMRVTNPENLKASNAFFAGLVQEAHKRGIRVVIDGVFNHCGSFNKWMDRERIYENQEGYEKGAYITADSPYHKFFRFNNEHEWPYNPFYEGWWGFDTLPKLNYEESKELEDYIMGIGKKWVSEPYCADGWRLDVAADLGFHSEYNHKFWKRFRQVVKEANPEAIILAEHYGDPSSWLRGDEWDTIMNYDAFMEPLTWFFTGMEKHSDRYEEGMLGNAKSFIDAMTFNMAKMLAPSLLTAMNELSNHDHSRFLTRTNHKVGRVQNLGCEAASEGVNPAVMREAVVMQMTWPGAPTLYYGDEAGVCGFTDPDNRRSYPWGKEDQTMLEFHRTAIAIHKAYPQLKCGSTIFLHADYNILAYGRFTLDDQAVIVFNNNDEKKEIRLSVWEAGVKAEAVLKRVLLTWKENYTQKQDWYPVKNGEIIITLPPLAAAVLIAEEKDPEKPWIL